MCFEMTQIIYLITDNECVTTISSFHGTKLPDSKSDEERSIKNLYDATRTRFAPHIIKIVSMVTSPDFEKLQMLLSDSIAAYYRKNWQGDATATSLINDSRYQRSGRSVQTELIKYTFDQMGVSHDS